LERIEMTKCPESIEELEALERMLPLCRRTLYATAKAKIDSGAASGIREASRQIGAETGRPAESIRRRIHEEIAVVRSAPEHCERPAQAPEWDPDAEEEETYHCERCSHYAYDKGVCWLHRDDIYGGDTCDDWLGYNDDGEAVITKPGVEGPEIERVKYNPGEGDPERQAEYKAAMEKVQGPRTRVRKLYERITGIADELTLLSSGVIQFEPGDVEYLVGIRNCGPTFCWAFHRMGVNLRALIDTLIDPKLPLQPTLPKPLKEVSNESKSEGGEGSNSE
jgi:hypothetical protein